MIFLLNLHQSLIEVLKITSDYFKTFISQKKKNHIKILIYYKIDLF